MRNFPGLLGDVEDGGGMESSDHVEKSSSNILEGDDARLDGKLPDPISYLDRELREECELIEGSLLEL